MTAIITLALIALIAYALDRNHHRIVAPHARLAGSTDIHDQDLNRAIADLAIADQLVDGPVREQAPVSYARRAATVRPASATR